ncbi:MAG: hybrid sensor histidine kinase/response regulator, partial [Candidatus Sedimenticola endophacoides]
PEGGGPGEKYQIDTIRIQTRQLDWLMNQAGELVVIRTRIEHRLDDIKELIDQWDELSASQRERQSVLRTLKKEGVARLNKLNELQERDASQLERLGERLGHLQTTSAEDNARLEAVTSKLEGGIRTVRLLPFSTVFNLFPRMIRDIARAQDKEVELLIEGGDTTADKRILEEMKDPLMHMLRNCVSHGIEPPGERERLGKPRTGTVWLKAHCTSASVIIEVVDDGGGLNLEQIRATALKQRLLSEEELRGMDERQLTALIFNTGFSTQQMITDISGRGVGMDVVRNNVESLKGSIQVESEPGVGSRFIIQLPLTLATTRVLLARLGMHHYALPVEFVDTTLRVDTQQLFTVETKETLSIDGHPVSIARLSDLLELPYSEPVRPEGADQGLPCILVRVGDERIGLLVDDVVDEQEVVLKPIGALLRRVRNVSGSTILGSGEVCMILNPVELVRTIATHGGRVVAPRVEVKSAASSEATVLLVEDSITTRIQEKRILESAGYRVIQAVDGLDALEKLGSHAVDAVVTDITMPNMDGLRLTQRIREEGRYQALPIILVTMLASDEDKRQGLAAGASAYLTKPSFDQSVLLDTLQRLV